jgi:hypothetical protein
MPKIFGFEPAVIVYALNAAVALLVSFGLPLSHDMVGAITTIATAVLSIVVAVMTRPVVVSTITAAAASVLTAAAAFGFHLTADQIGYTVTALSIGLALLLRQNVTPTAALPTSRATRV